MPYTLWMHDKQIGETRFEVSTTGRRRAGMFHPTAYGLTMLPGITAMFPALIAFGELCRREGLDVDDDRPEKASAALDAFGGTPEGQRVIAAARQIATVVVRDSTGRTMVWESLAISDLGQLATLARKHASTVASLASVATCSSGPGPGAGDPAKYLVSLTLAARRDGSLSGAQHLGAQRREASSN